MKLFVSTQRFSLLPNPSPFRVCEKYQPILINETNGPITCLEELTSASKVQDQDADKSIIQISVENGYEIQSYKVTTSDGYILTMFRIPGGFKSPARNGKPSVLLLHGWGNSCEIWIALPNDKNLAFMLADAGYDVWLGAFEARLAWTGCVIKCAFSISFHEIGIYDIPTMVDQILMVSGNDKIFVIGHSMGGATILVAAAEIPTMNQKINAAFLLEPAAQLGGLYDPAILATMRVVNTPAEDFIYELVRGRIQMRNPRLLLTALGIQLYELCEPTAVRCGLCDLTGLGLRNFNPAQMNYTNLPRMLSKLNDIGSLRSLFHLSQNARSCSFRYYDRETAENLRRYGQVNPPRYNLSAVTAPLYLFWGEQDAIVTPPDVQRLANELSPAALRGVFRVNDDTFNHYDFVVARDANVLVYKPLIELMNNFEERVS
ncbi:Lipase 3 [Orchesella cincta]|uniref:Lipase n=1 Tax=Orchesella cincta TaxID=48709 RepID=A0A1D2MI38_ORCCI|nr:Lipase 3 [Orchesella cincta]